MKEKVIVLILLTIILLFPIPHRYKDGGSVEYRAILYSVTDVHRIAIDTEKGFDEGIIVEAFGFEIFNNLDR